MLFVNPFFLMLIQFVWTSEKNSFLIETVNSIVSINADFKCSEAFDLFCSDPELLNLAKCNQKY